jgi:transcriptional regulator with XRE-family HTH domain
MIDSALMVCPSKSAIARTLGVSPQRLWHYESGMKHMPAHLVMRLATLANMPAVTALGQYEAEWSGKKTWRVAAGIAGAAFSLVALSLAHGDVDANTMAMGERAAHYAQRLRELLRQFLQAGARRLAGVWRRGMTTPQTKSVFDECQSMPA